MLCGNIPMTYGVGVGGYIAWDGGYFTKFPVTGFSTRTFLLIQLDLGFCKNERSKKSKINEKWGQLH